MDYKITKLPLSAKLFFREKCLTSLSMATNWHFLKTMSCHCHNVKPLNKQIVRNHPLQATLHAKV